MRDANEVFDARYDVDESGCWLWAGDKDSNGYGRFMVNGIRLKAHRFSFERFNGPLNGLDCCHRCDTPDCVNPDHLFAGTALPTDGAKFIGEDYGFCNDYIARTGVPIPVWTAFDFVHGGFKGNLFNWLTAEKDKADAAKNEGADHELSSAA